MEDVMRNAMTKRVEEIKKELCRLRVVRPGKISMQKRGAGKRRYNYLSYTFRNESYTEYIKANYVDEINKETEAYTKFKELIDEWVELSIKLSKLKMRACSKPEVSTEK